MRRRLLASYLAVAVLVLGLLAIPLAISYAHSERQSLTDKVERDAFALASLVEDSLEQGTGFSSAVRRTARNYDAQTGGRVVVVDSTGRAVIDTAPTGSVDFSSRPEISQALSGRVATGVRGSRTLDADLLYVAVPVASSGVVHGAVRIAYPTSAIESRVHRYLWWLAAIAAVVLVAATGIAMVLARWVVQPLERLEEAAERIGSGELTARAPVEGPPEVQRLTETFNSTVAKLDTLLRSQDAFVADASHQLRTPLAALRLRLENLASDIDGEGRPEVEGALGEVERLSALVGALLTLARTDRAPAARESIEIEPVVDERLAAWSALAEEREVRLQSQVVDGLRAAATPGHVEQILDNLLANALDASPEGGTVTVSAQRTDGWVEVHVADEGPGMPADERERAFDRFWRGRAGSDGFGLGLGIVERLVTDDGGSVELSPSITGGVDAVVRLRRPHGDS